MMTAERLNEVWQIDASRLLGTGKQPNIYVAIDVYSRRVIILVTLTPRAEGVALLIRKCLMAWGVPERIRTDHASDFRASATARLFSALDIEVEYSPLYSPWQKGTVECVIGTFQRDLARRLPRGAENFLPDIYAVGAALYADRWASEIHAHTPHHGLGGRTPHEAAASYAGPVRRLDSARGLDVLLAPVVGIAVDGSNFRPHGAARQDGEFGC